MKQWEIHRRVWLSNSVTRMYGIANLRCWVYFETFLTFASDSADALPSVLSAVAACSELACKARMAQVSKAVGRS